MIHSKNFIQMTNVYNYLYIVSKRLFLTLEFLCLAVNPRP